MVLENLPPKILDQLTFSAAVMVGSNKSHLLAARYYLAAADDPSLRELWEAQQHLLGTETINTLQTLTDIEVVEDFFENMTYRDAVQITLEEQTREMIETNNSLEGMMLTITRGLPPTNDNRDIIDDEIRTIFIQNNHLKTDQKPSNEIRLIAAHHLTEIEQQLSNINKTINEASPEMKNRFYFYIHVLAEVNSQRVDTTPKISSNPHNQKHIVDTPSSEQ